MAISTKKIVEHYRAAVENSLPGEDLLLKLLLSSLTAAEQRVLAHVVDSQDTGVISSETAESLRYDSAYASHILGNLVDYGLVESAEEFFGQTRNRRFRWRLVKRLKGRIKTNRGNIKNV